MRAGLVAVLLAAALLGGCERESNEPRAQVYVLVDLSQTWHNPASDPRNMAVLSEIGAGIAAVADDFEPPVSVQYHVIGQSSLEREPICDAFYQPSVTSTKKAEPKYMVRKLRKLRDILTFDCPTTVLSKPAEPLTEISAALATVARQPAGQNARRYIIVASDFLEESAVSGPQSADFTGFKVLVVYRPIAEDQRRPGDMTARVDAWRAQIEDLGGQVSVVPDTALKRASIESFLWRK